MDEQLHGQPTKAQPPIAPELEIVQGEEKGKIFTITPTTRLGRERDNDVILIDPKISRYHAEILKEGDRWVVTDLGSSNHTYLNGEEVTGPVALQHNDRLKLGEIELAFNLPAGHSDDTLAYQTKSKQTAPPLAAPVQQAAPARGLASSKSSPPPRIALLAGAFVVLLCLAAAVVLFMISRLPGDDEGAPVAGATTTAGAELATDEAPTPNPDTPATAFSLVYEDDFSDSFSGWDDAFDAHTTKQYGNNRYQIEVSTSNLIAWGLANRDVSDFELEVEARQEAGGETNSFGLLFRFQDHDNFYRFDISGDGFFLVSKFVAGEWTTLVDWTASPHISQETNLVKVSAFGPKITVRVNGQELASLTDDSLQHGNFGFFASTFDDNHMWVSYDNLKLWTPEGQEIALIPTATRPSAPLVSAPEADEAPAAQESVEEEPAIDEEPAEQSEAGVEVESGTQTPLPTPRPTHSPTNTPQSLPEYVARDQSLGREKPQLSGRIIFPQYDTERGTYDIYVADAADGTNLELVQTEASQPTFNQDGSEIAYRSWQGDKRGLYARALDSDDAWGFDLFFESARPQFSKDGSLMYYSRTGGNEPALYQVIDGTGQVMRNDGAPIQGLAAKWGPDGQQFVYNSCIGGKCGLILGNLNGSQQQLTDNPSDTNPEISPDGSTIVFMSERSGDWEIYQIDLAGQNLTALTNDDASDGLPTWSPDGENIAFVSSRDGEWAIWDMQADGSDKRRLFGLDGSIDGVIQHDPVNSFGWIEENIDWGP